MSSTKITCPVCGAGPTTHNRRVTDCPVCRTKDAFVEYFASKEVYEAWNDTIQVAKNAYRNRQLNRLRARGKLIIGPEYLSFLDEDASMLMTLTASAKLPQSAVSSSFPSAICIR